MANEIGLRMVKSPVADISAEERFYSRSLKIRLGIWDALRYLDQLDESLVWNSMDDLAHFGANFIFDNGWDIKPASSVTCARWIKTCLAFNGQFVAVDCGQGSFKIQFVSPDMRRRVSQSLKAHRKKRKVKAKPALAPERIEPVEIVKSYGE